RTSSLAPSAEGFEASVADEPAHRPTTRPTTKLDSKQRMSLAMLTTSTPHGPGMRGQDSGKEFFEPGQQALGLPGFGRRPAAAGLLRIETGIVPEPDDRLDPRSHFGGAG